MLSLFFNRIVKFQKFQVFFRVMLSDGHNKNYQFNYNLISLKLVSCVHIKYHIYRFFSLFYN